jgi:hypothetical protein
MPEPPRMNYLGIWRKIGVGMRNWILYGDMGDINYEKR